MLPRLLQLIKTNQSDIALAVAVIVISVISFQSGKIYALKGQEGGIVIKNAAPEEIFDKKVAGKTLKISGLENSNMSTSASGSVVASKNSTVYHFPWCPGAGKISEKNKITFPNEAAAIAAGLTLASNCKK